MRPFAAIAAGAAVLVVAQSAFAAQGFADPKVSLGPFTAAPFAPAAVAAHATFSDPSGDGGAGADVTDVQVGNDIVAGPIVIWIDTPNRSSLSGTETIFVFLDSDLSPGTGQAEAGGADFVVELTGGASAILSRWDAASAQYVQAASASLRGEFVASAKSTRFSIHPSDLGGTRGFNFFVVTSAGEELGDVAPDGSALWSFSLRPGPLRLSVGEFAISPRAPRAGGRFAAAMVVVRDDINETLGEGAVTCTLRIGTTTVRATGRGFAEDAAVCVWRLPRSAKGKQLRGTITVTFGGVRVTKTFSARVR